MIRPSHHVLSKLALLSAILASIFTRQSIAQKYKEVEIEVAGPWAYVVDPGDASRIVVVSPNVNHAMDVFGGGDANGFSQEMDPGLYSLNFTPTKCATHHKVTQPNLLELTTDAIPNSIKNALGAKNKRFALSLPKPCYYETYLDSRAKVAASTIDAGTQEESYTIWMSLHYTVLDSTSSADLKGTPDSGNAYPSTPIRFTANPWPPSAEAISVVAYYAAVGDDYLCDSHSAHHFDAALSLWGQPGLHRLFPELDASGKQTHRYQYDQATCQQTLARGEHRRQVSSTELQRQLQGIRTDLKNSDLDAAITHLKALRSALSELWVPRAPQALLDDLSESASVLDRLKDRGGKFPPDNAPFFLKVTEFFLAPGRADCHAMQVNIDNAVP